MIIGIMSDTHKKLGRTKKALKVFANHNCEHIIHAGDIGSAEVIEAIHESGIPFSAVLGNNDRALYEMAQDYGLRQEPYSFELDRVRFKLMHHPYYLADKNHDFIIYGHTHAPLIEQYGQVFYINPGEVCARDTQKSHVMILETYRDQYIIHHLQRSVGEKTQSHWIKNTKIFQRQSNLFSGDFYE